ncbi:Uncharacterised protein [uncultured archaeon]|nr:Uncharacterised protein [uncultured archaeon]
MKEIEAAFSTTSGIVLGKKLAGLDDYGPWLTKDVLAKVNTAKSVKSGKTVFLPTLEYYGKIGRNALTLEESLEHGKNAITEREAEALSVANASGALAGIKATTPEVVYDKNIGTQECADYGPTQYCYRSGFAWFEKYCGYCFWARTSEYMFGCSSILNSKFCIKCSDSVNLTRCFEVSDGRNCSDSYFCHNVENVQEGMFCFNTKNKKYAIGNIEVGREKYMEIKKMLLSQIADELDKKKSFRYTVFNIGCAR